MGTVLSLSPRARKAAARVPEPELSEAGVSEHEEQKKKKKKPRHRNPVLLHALSWKKRLVAARAKRKGGKKVKPAAEADSGHAHTDSRVRTHKNPHRHGPIPVPVPTVPEPDPEQRRRRPEQSLSPRRVVVQASTGELLRCLSDFLCRRCVKLKVLSSNQIVSWFRNVDRVLLVQGWQDQCFLSPSSLVFVYMLCREAVDEDTASEQELHATFLTCLYLAYSYQGNEISYPLKPFLVESCRDAFWERALELIERLSFDMLRINTDPHFFTEVFQDLKCQGGSREEEEKKEEEKEKKGEKKEEKEEEKEKKEEEENTEEENTVDRTLEDLDR